MMAANEKRQKNGRESKSWFDLHPETQRSVWGIAALGVAALFVLALAHQGGRVGEVAERLAIYLLGWGAFMVPLLLAAGALVLFFSSSARRVPVRVLAAGALWGVALEALLGLSDPAGVRGGVIGRLLVLPSGYLFGYWASYLLWTITLVISLLVFFNATPFRPRHRSEEDGGEAPAAGRSPELPGEGIGARLGNMLRPRFLLTRLGGRSRGGETERDGESLPAGVKASSAEVAPKTKTSQLGEPVYAAPPLDLLETESPEPMPGDVELHATLVKRTLENFGIGVEMGEVNVGPTVTQYTLKPAEGVKLSRIVALANDLALALAAHPLRIEAPIPGRSLVGIEIPNKRVATVRLRSLLEEEEFRRFTQPLALAMGRDVTGTGLYDTLTRMPHLLIAGSTGSGKSIAIHGLLTALLYRHSPEELQLILVDPKRVELMPYTGIGHLLAPVIVEPQQTVRALGWAITEMERRYGVLAEAGVRDIASYHSTKKKMPYLVIVIDELADIMAAFGRELEAAVVRLAQMARAVGIHLVLSTQRPSIEVITGLIKANITARLACQVASQIDSRTIIDTAGAEKLLGSGDMLFLRGDGSKPKRVQGAFISEREVKRVTDWLKKKGAERAESATDFPALLAQTPALLPNGDSALARAENGWPRGEAAMDSRVPAWDVERFSSPAAAREDEVDEPLYEEAKRVVREAGRASASLLQRRLRVGYARAARLIDIMEEHGVVGPGNGAKAREVLLPEHR